MFETKSGKAQWEIVLAVLSTKNIGDVVKDDEILLALGPGFPAHSLSNVVNKAIREFRANKRTFERVRKVGWRMVEATEHSRLARKQQVRGRRRLRDAVSISASTDLSLLSPEQRRTQRVEELHLRRLYDALSRRVDKVEDRVGTVEKATVSTDEKLDRLTDLLRRHGISDEE
jgi:hypothetical protein